MTAKRFEINKNMNLNSKVETYELSCIVDNSNKTFYFVVDSIANVESFVERLNDLHEENEQLKQTLRIYRKVANCRNCDFHTYDWFDDGDEFETCKKGKDMENSICEYWSEL